MSGVLSAVKHFCLLPQGNVFTRVCHSVQGRCISACITGHMTKDCISSCTGDRSQLVQGEHTGNIKCIMG